MAQINETRAYLRISGDDLDPLDVTSTLGAEPDYAFGKGDIYRQRVADTGRWVIHADDAQPGNLDVQVAGLLARMTDDLAAWRRVTGRHEALFYGSVFMVQTNEGGVISPATLLALGQRGVSFGLDIYAPRRAPDRAEA